MSENTKTGESSKSQNYTETNNNSAYGDIKIDKSNIEKIEGTLFSIANDPETGWFLSIGKYIITEPFPTKEEAISQLELDKWNIIMKMIILVVNTTIDTIEKPYN